MPRSSGMPSSSPLGGITRIIRARSRSVTLERPTKTTNSLGTTEETLAEHTESMWLFEPTESVSQEMTGEQINGGLGALVVADTPNIKKDDRITYGGVEYEVDTVVGHPQDAAADGTEAPNVDFFVVDFRRRQ